MSGNGTATTAGTSSTIDIVLHVWRQAPGQEGRMVTYVDEAKGISPDMSFLEMLDIVNERLIAKGEEPIAFEHDCREGICGSCGMMINGQAHGPERGTATCQLHMRKFSHGDEVFVEPWRARAFPVLQDLIVDRQAFDRIIEAGGYITAPTGAAPDGNLSWSRREASTPPWTRPPASAAAPAWPPAPTSAAQLFTSAKLAHLNLLPQGQAERYAARRRWSTRWSSTSARAPCTASARRPAPRRSRSTSSPT